MEEIHAKAMKRFRRARHSMESDSDADSVEVSTTADDPVDPDIAIYDPDTGGVHCKICNMDLNSKKQFVDHLKGGKHKKNRDKKEREEKKAADAQARLVSPLQ